MSKLPGEGPRQAPPGIDPCRERPPWRSSEPRDPTAHEIDAEIADHLATSAERLQSQGHSANNARAQSQEKFGDIATIARRCYWVQQGDHLMFRTAVIVLLVILALGLGTTTLSSLRTQQQMAQQMAVLAEQLRSVAERQLPPLASEALGEMRYRDPVVQPPQEITGKVYVKEPSVPASKKEVLVLSANDGKIVRRVMTDDQGRYHSGPLAAGDYCLVAGVENVPLQHPYYPYLQSSPIYVYPGLPATGHDLDVSRQVGRLSVELSRPLPRLESKGKYVIESRLLIRVAAERDRRDPWISSLKMPSDWPLYIPSVTVDNRPNESSRYFLELLTNANLEDQQSQTHFGDRYGLLPTGRAAVTAAVITDIIPFGYEPPELPVQETKWFGRVAGPAVVQAKRFSDEAWNRAYQTTVSRRGVAPAGLDREFAWNLQNDGFHWLTKGLGQIWLRQMKSSAEKQSEPPEPYTNLESWLTTNATSDWICQAPIQSDCLTRLRIEVPEDIAARIQTLVATTLDPADFAKFTLGDDSPPPPEIQSEIARGTHPLFRKVKISVLNTESLPPASE